MYAGKTGHEPQGSEKESRLHSVDRKPELERNPRRFPSATFPPLK